MTASGSAARIVRRSIVVLALFGAAAVSYTHLRAHETVLDLVCRLLLEKKKNRVRYTSTWLGKIWNIHKHEHRQSTKTQ